MSINEVKALEPAHLADIVGAPVNKQQLVRLGGFCDQALCENAGEVVATAKGAGHDLRWLGRAGDRLPLECAGSVLVGESRHFVTRGRLATVRPAATPAETLRSRYVGTAIQLTRG